jgi:hypothetical protein
LHFLCVINEAKPKPKLKPSPGGRDYLLELDGVKGKKRINI